MTDMGRYYIILGPPNSIDRLDNTKDVWPTRIWYYFGDKRLGFPTYFALVFNKRGSVGEYKLYNPGSDGPMSLLINPEGLDYTNYRKQYEKIFELAPTLARVSITNTPGEIPYNYMPSLRTNILLSKIAEAPRKEVQTTYASHFLDYKGYVSTDYLTNFIDCDAGINITRDPILGMNFVHFSLVPQRISIDYYEPKAQYYCNYSLNVSLRKGEEIIYQYSKDFPFYFTQERVQNIKASGVSIQDSFPFVEGEYKLTLLIQNSVAKEFSVYEKEIIIPEEERAQILDSFLGYKIEENRSFSHFPYKIADKKILVDPKNTFSKNDNLILFFNVINVSEKLWKNGRVEVTIKGAKRLNPVEKFFSFGFEDLFFSKALRIFKSLPIEELVPDYYELKLALKDEGSMLIDSKRINFIVSPQPQLPHPISLYKIFSLSNRFLYFYTLAYQYARINESEKAEAHFKKAYKLKPDYKEGLVGYTNFLLKVKKFAKTLELIENIKDDEDLKFEYYLIRGRAYTGMGKYEEAIDNLLEGNKIYNSDIRLLNTLGFCFYKTGEEEKALEVLKASLRLNPQQEGIKKLIEEIEEFLSRK
jgi:tetratricopeptide (TPR) repeat protein